MFTLCTNIQFFFFCWQSISNTTLELSAYTNIGRFRLFQEYIQYICDWKIIGSLFIDMQKNYFHRVCNHIFIFTLYLQWVGCCKLLIVFVHWCLSVHHADTMLASFKKFLALNLVKKMTVRQCIEQWRATTNT